MKQLITLIIVIAFASCGPSKEELKKARMAQAKMNQEIKEMQRFSGSGR